MLKIPVSFGELIDKITILEIKLKNATSEEKYKNIKKELFLLYDVLGEQKTEDILVAYMKRLKDVNQRLWVIEDEIRIKEANLEFDDEFITLARSVYKENDTRARLKNMINTVTNSSIIEEKIYTPYGETTHD